MEKKKTYMTIENARQFEHNLVYFTGNADYLREKFKTQDLIITNTADKEDVHPRSAEFVKAVKDYHKALSTINEILR